MARFDIRKAAGKEVDPMQKQPLELVGTLESTSHVTEKEKSQKEKTPSISVEKTENDLEILGKKINVFDTLVSHSYLYSLEHASILSPTQDVLPAVKWYKVIKIVLDKDKFFPDQLSMLYTALHSVAGNIALLINKKGYDDFEIFVGARDLSGNLFESSSLLGTAINGYLPGVKTQLIKNEFTPIIGTENYYVASYSGVASLRDDKKEDFIQGIEKFIDATVNIPTYQALFIADHISASQTTNIINSYGAIYDSFMPLAELQEAFSENETTGVSHTITESLSNTLTESVAETVTRNEGTNSSVSHGTGKTYNHGVTNNPHILKSLWTKIMGGETHNDSEGDSYQEGKQYGKHLDRGKSDQKSKAESNTNQKGTSDTSNSNTTKGVSRTITKTNSLVKRYLDIINKNIERLQNGLPYGLWSVGTYFISPNDSTSKKLANIYRGCITGEESNLDASAINVWDKENSKKILDSLSKIQNPRFIVGGIDVSSGEIVSSKELAIHMSLPQFSIPGIEVREMAPFGRNPKFVDKDKGLGVGKITHLGNVSIKDLYLDLEELSKHVFITGSTGSGKSNTVYLLVNELLKKGIKILIIEPTKGDYKKVFGGRDDITVYGTRLDEKNLLRINPFAFPDGIKVVEHVERLIEIFGVCWPMYAAMPAVLKDSILSAYKACGWNLRTSKCKYGNLFPTVEDVVIQLKNIINNSQYSADTKGDYIGALQTRLESLTNGIYESILCSSEAIAYQDLYDKNAIIDIHNIGSSETRSLLMGLLILNLTEWRMSQGEEKMDQSLQHVTILEEAHNLLPRVSKQQSQEGANVLGKSVEMIASAIAEMRTYGESFIIVDQSPSAVDESAIRNTNTKIIMNLPDGDDREIAGKAIAITKEEQINELARLATGEALVWQRGWSDPIFTTIFEMKDKTPLIKEKNYEQIDELENYIPQEPFIKFFILKDKNLSDSELNSLKKEIRDRNLRSGIKAKLLQEINESKHISNIELNSAIIDFLGIRKQILQILSKFNKGSIDLIKDCRMIIKDDLNIKEQKIQNHLIAIIFRWASFKKDKWKDICQESFQLIKQKNK